MPLRSTTIQTNEAEAISLIGVDYLRLKTGDGGDLYLTRFGLPFLEHLVPENWYSSDWFEAQRIRLKGTSSIFRVPTKPVGGVNLDLVVRFSRVGEEVPLDMLTRYENIHAEFNSPFEEFSLVMQLRAACIRPSRPRILTKKPLAIHAPAERLQLWQTGRSESTIAAKLARLSEAPIDILRQYILIYGWIDGLNAVEAVQAPGATQIPPELFLAETTLRASHDLKRNGFRMVDIKPEHIILRVLPDGSLLRRRNGNPAYALIDYELLESLQDRS